MTQILLQIYFKSMLKDFIVDLLLNAGYENFFYHDGAMYAHALILKESSEQVSGRQEYGMIKVFLKDEMNAEKIAREIHSNFDSNDIKICKGQVEII